MIYTITTIGIILVFVVEYLIQRHESNNLFGFFKSISLYKTIEQILIVVLSATIAILMTNTSEKNNTRKQYKTLLENVYVEIKTEEEFLDAYINKTADAEYLEGATDDQINSLMKRNDCSFLLNNVLNTSEAALNLGPNLYSTMMREVNERSTLLEALYAEDYSAYGDRISTLSLLEEADNHLAILILGQLDYLDGKNDSELSELYYKSVYAEYYE